MNKPRSIEYCVCYTCKKLLWFNVGDRTEAYRFEFPRNLPWTGNHKLAHQETTKSVERIRIEIKDDGRRQISKTVREV